MSDGGGISGIVKRATAWALELKPVRAYLRYSEHHGPMLADSVTYRALFSVFAGVFLGFAIAGVWLAGNPDAMDALISALDSAIPGLVGQGGLIDPDDLVQPLSLSIAGILALLGLVFTAMGAINSLRVAFRDIGDQPPSDRFFALQKLLDLALAIAVGVGLAAAAAVTFASTAALDAVAGWLGIEERTPVYSVLAWSASALVIFAIDSLVIAMMFRALSGITVAPRALWAGSLLGGFGLLVLQQLSGLFIGGATSNPLLASFGSIIALLIWFNFSSQVILIAGSYIVTGYNEERDRVHERHGASTMALRKLRRAELKAADAAAVVVQAREAVEVEQATERAERSTRPE